MPSAHPPEPRAWLPDTEPWHSRATSACHLSHVLLNPLNLGLMICTEREAET